jgi:hypothetical protein
MVELSIITIITILHTSNVKARFFVFMHRLSVTPNLAISLVKDVNELFTSVKILTRKWKRKTNHTAHFSEICDIFCFVFSSSSHPIVLFLLLIATYFQKYQKILLSNKMSKFALPIRPPENVR